MANYAFNPITNKIDRIGDDGGGGGGNVTIRGQDGSSITGDDFQFIGQEFGTSETSISEVDTSTGEVRFTYNAWETPYVVDLSSDPEEKGTYSTIQSAIDAAVLDGATLTTPKVILIRPGAYTEDLNIPPGIFLKGPNLIASTVAAVPEIVELFGNHTLQGSNIFRAQGISFRNPTPSVRMFSIAPGASTVFFNFVNCWINAGSSPLPSITTDFQYNRFSGCTFNGPAYTPAIEVLVGGVVNLNNCVFASPQQIINSGLVEVWDSTIGEIICDSGTVFAYNTSFRSQVHCISGDSGGVLASCCSFSSSGSSVNVNSLSSSGVTLNSCSLFEGAGDLYEFGSTVYVKPSMAGNVQPHVVVEGDFSLNSNYQVIYCNTENVPCNLILFQNPALDRVWTIKDSFGNASKNPITLYSINSQTVDKQPSYVIDSDFGCVTIQANEAGDFTVLSEAKMVGGNSAPSMKITKFSANGTWTPEPLAKMSRHLLWGGGGGGASGRAGASGLASGGGGGAPGHFVDAIIDHSLLLDTSYSVIVGIGGVGGTSVSGTEVNGNAGTSGGNSSVGDPSETGLSVSGGNAGQAGGTATGPGGTTSRFLSFGVSGTTFSGGNGSNSNGTAGIAVFGGAASGGGGGAGYTSGTSRSGSVGGSIFGSGDVLYLAQGGTAGSSAGGNGGDGNSYTGPLLSIGGSGGGSGGHDGVTTAGSGGNGATPGGGGGGGAGNLSGNPSGAGGNGGSGQVIIIEYF